MLRAALFSILALGFAWPALAQSAGVTAAVNQSAQGTPPGGNVRTIVLGDNIVQDERIDTNADGLVQILLADGTTFTVGPNSSLSIDRFVYDPASNTAQVTASVTRGVFRFIGGRTSKTEDGVQINTPVGTVGIRGAVVNFSVGGGTGTHFDLVFGKEVTLSGPGGLLERLFRPGYSIAIGAGGSTQVIQTPPDWTAIIQQALTARPGTSGGASRQPSNQQVAQSGIGAQNSDATLPMNVPDGPIDVSAIQTLQQLTPDNHQLAEEIGGHAPGPGTPFEGTFQGFGAGFVVTLDGNGNEIYQPVRNPDAADLFFTFDPDTPSFGGQIALEASLAGPVLDLKMVFGDPQAGGTSQFVDNEFFVATGLPNSLEANLVGPGVVNGTGGAGAAAGGFNGTGYVDGLCVCAFMQWGVWSADVQLPGGDPLQSVGFWVSGDVASTSEFDSYASSLPVGTTATYDGIAIGTVTGGAAAFAAGDLSLTYDFGARAGEMDITNFDGRDFTGMEFSGGPTFSGIGTTPFMHNVSGAFVNADDDVAKGVIGNFDLQDGTWGANGIFAGQR